MAAGEEVGTVLRCPEDRVGIEAVRIGPKCGGVPWPLWRAPECSATPFLVFESFVGCLSLEAPPSILDHKWKPARQEIADYLSSTRGLLSSWWQQQHLGDVASARPSKSGWKEVWLHPWGRED